jgi:hypothetical protein
MLVGVNDVSVVAKNKVGDRGVDAFLVGTIDQQDGGGIHGKSNRRLEMERAITFS